MYFNLVDKKKSKKKNKSKKIRIIYDSEEIYSGLLI